MHSYVNVHSWLHCSSDGRHLPQATRRSKGHRITCAVLLWCQRQCLTCSTLWALRTIWWWLMILAVAANNAFGYQGKRYAIGCLDSCKRILVVRARVHICMVCLESIFWLRRHHPIYVPWKLGEKFLVKEIFSMILSWDATWKKWTLLCYNLRLNNQ